MGFDCIMVVSALFTLETFRWTEIRTGIILVEKLWGFKHQIVLLEIIADARLKPGYAILSVLTIPCNSVTSQTPRKHNHMPS